ncbi:MAG: D-arabinono-1,4-lactone oxidase [Myxococcaceae bacterium]
MAKPPSPDPRKVNNLPLQPLPADDVSPVTDAALRHAISVGSERGVLKALAGGWGFNLAGTTPGTRVRMTNFSGISPAEDLRPGAWSRPFDFDPTVPHEQPGPLMRVLAGTTFGDLNRALHPYTVVNQPGFELLTFGGVMMVGGHGSGIRRGNIASQVRSLDLYVVKADGALKLMRIEPASDPITDADAFTRRHPGAELLLDDEVFNTVKVSFGTMGVLHSVVIDTRPAYRLEEDRDARQLWRDFDKIEEQVRRPEVAGVHLWVNPYKFGFDYTALQSTYRRSVDMQRNERGWGIRDADSPITRGITNAAATFPISLPWALQFSFTSLTADDVVMPSPEALDFGPPNKLKVSAASCSLPADGLKERLAALLHHFKVTFPKNAVSSLVGIRWVKASNATLAPQRDRDSVMIEVPVLAPTPNLDETLEKYVTFMVNELGARPHWGQRLWLDNAQLRKVYGSEAVDTFIRVRRQLDPRGAFDNDFTRQLGL